MIRDLDRVPGKLEPELPDVLGRAQAVAGELGDRVVRYLGAGASAMVFETEAGRALKVARLRDYNEKFVLERRVYFLDEFDYLNEAGGLGLPVCSVEDFFEDHIVLVKEFVPGKPGTWFHQSALYKIWEDIVDDSTMVKRWGGLEFKEENFIVPHDSPASAILIDAGGVVRRGDNLVDYILDEVVPGHVVDIDAWPPGRGMEAHLRWSVRMDALDGRIDPETEQGVLAALDERFGR